MLKQIFKFTMLISGLISVLLFYSCCEVETVAGNGAVGDLDGSVTSAQFNHPSGIATDANGNIYVADYQNHIIRKIDLRNDIVTTFAGTGVPGCSDSTNLKNAQFKQPMDIALDSDNNFYVADRGNHIIQKIDVTNKIVTIFAGQCNVRMAPEGCDDAPIKIPASIHADKAIFRSPSGIAVDGAGNVYVADHGNCCVRKIDAVTRIVTLVGHNAEESTFVECCSCNGLFDHPTGIDLDSDGNIYVAEEWGRRRILKIAPDGTVTTLAGGGAGYRNGAGSQALFSHPHHIAADNLTGNVYVADRGNNRIRRIKNNPPVYSVCTLAGNGISGWVDDEWSWGSDCCGGEGGDVQFNNPQGITLVLPFGLYIGDTGNHRIRSLVFGEG